MSIFVTGSTGFLGSYVVSGLLSDHDERLSLLVRASSVQAAKERLWNGLQVHMDFEPFRQFVEDRVDIYLGDLTSPAMGLEPSDYDRLVKSTSSIIHIAASLNRRSDKQALNVNLRGTLGVLKLARAVQDHHGLRRISDVSTSAVAGERNGEHILEDESIEWSRNDYDPYARSKKFCEHMLHELLPEVPQTVFRPSIVMGDSRFPATTQFDMVRAFVYLARLPVIPLHPDWRIDIVPANYVGKAIVELHQRDELKHDIYHLAAGAASLTARELIGGLRIHGKHLRGKLVPTLADPIGRLATLLSNTPRKWGISGVSGLFRVFWPYICFDTVFDNSRVVDELGEAPAVFTDYGSELMDYVLDHDFTYPYLPWPPTAPNAEVTSSPA